MFVPYFVGIVHDLLEWVDAPTYGSWTLGGLGSVSGAPALPPAPPAPPSPYPPPFPPTSSWFLGIKPLKPILKPAVDDVVPTISGGLAYVYNPMVNAMYASYEETTFYKVFENSMALQEMASREEY